MGMFDYVSIPKDLLREIGFIPTSDRDFVMGQTKAFDSAKNNYLFERSEGTGLWLFKQQIGHRVQLEYDTDDEFEGLEYKGFSSCVVHANEIDIRVPLREKVSPVDDFNETVDTTLYMTVANGVLLYVTDEDDKLLYDCGFLPYYKGRIKDD